MVSTSNISITAPTGLVSILIPCCGMLEYTRMCVPSVLRHTCEPYELIFLDVGSLDGTAEYLEGLRDGLAGRLRVEAVRCVNDLGIKDACMKALEKARGEYLCLLNNDTVVTAQWMNALKGLLGLSPALGMAGPMTGCAAPPQLVETLPYRVGPRKGAAAAGEPLVDVAAVERFAAEYHLANQKRWLEVERLGGFCLLLRREVVRKMGQELGQWSDLGLFDTDILSSKARQNGYTLGCCRDLFIHHFGTRTFAHGPPASALTTGSANGSR